MIITVHNRKGGVGKTTTSVNLAAHLAQAGERVLLIDGDNQHNASRALGFDPRPAVWEWMTQGHFEPEHPRATLDLLPTSAYPDAECVDWERQVTGDIIRIRLAAIPSYDWIIIDTAPSRSAWNSHLLAIADAYLIPVDFSLYSIEGVSELMAQLDRTRVIGLVPVRYDLRNNRSIELLDLLKHAGGGLVSPPIRVAVDVDRAVQHGQAMFEYNARSHAAEDYRTLTDWVVMHLAETQLR